MALTQSEVDISASLDERAGFFTHYVLNVSWCPTTCTYIHTRSFSTVPLYTLYAQLFFPIFHIGTEQVSRYVVTRNPGGGDCGRTVSVTADAVSCTGTAMPAPLIFSTWLSCVPIRSAEFFKYSTKIQQFKTNQSAMYTDSAGISFIVQIINILSPLTLFLYIDSPIL